MLKMKSILYQQNFKRLFQINIQRIAEIYQQYDIIIEKRVINNFKNHNNEDIEMKAPSNNIMENNINNVNKDCNGNFSNVNSSNSVNTIHLEKKNRFNINTTYWNFRQ